MRNFDQVVANAMRRRGGISTLRVFTTGTYDPDTGSVSETQTDYTVKTVILDYPAYNIGDKSEYNTLILAGDKQCFMMPYSKSNPPATEPLVNANKDILIDNLGTEWKIITKKEMNPSGTDVVYFEFHLRK